MKTKEFISKMNEVAGAEIDESNTVINIDFPAGETVGWVSIHDFGAVDTSGMALNNMKNKEEVVKLIFEYALTPLDEREDELKFRVRMLPGGFNWDTYLNQDKDSKNVFLNGLAETDNAQTIFTKSEYDKLQQKYHDWLPKFDKNDPHFEFLEEDK